MLFRHDCSGAFGPSRALHFALLTCLFLCGQVYAADENNAGDIAVVDVRGEAYVTMGGKTRTPKIGSVVVPAATIATGVNSALELQQGATTVAISASTLIELPETDAPGGMLDRIVQSSGNVYYKVGKREARKLRVETPYLVAVVKGTQFNVSTQDGGATIALFEGQLEVRAPDGSDVVDLYAGEIAVRRGNDAPIRVLRMDTGETLRGSLDLDTRPANNSNETTTIGIDGNVLGAATAAPGIGVGAIAVPTATGVVANVGANEGAALGGTNMSISAATGANLSEGTASLNVSAGASLGSVGANVGVSASLGLSSGSVDLGTGVGANLGAAGVSAGATTTTAVSLSSGTVDLGTSATAAVGSVASTSVSANTGVALSSGTIDLGTSTSTSVGSSTVSTGVGASVSSGGTSASVVASVPGVNLGVTVGTTGTSVSLGTTTTTGTSTSTTTSSSSTSGSTGLISAITGRLGL